MIFDPNPLFFEILRLYKSYKTPENLVTICNEGSSRSSKTFDFFHFLVMFCDHNRGAELEFYVLRDLLTDCRDYTYKEFKKCLKIIGVWDEEAGVTSPKPYYNLFGNHVFFRGLDDDKEAPPSDGIFVNEALEIDRESKIKGWRMRCRLFMVYDWNPKYTEHWCFNMKGRPNTFFTHSTYKNNKHLAVSIANEIESYCPWHFDDLDLPENERRPHPYNLQNGTADIYQWLVYGAGIRTAPEGLIFQNVNYIDEWPMDVAHVYGLDFGFTVDPSALTKVGETATDIYLELLLYEPTATPDMLNSYAEAIGLDKSLPCTADSADKYTGENRGTVEMVEALKSLGWNITKVSKTRSIIFWINEMKKKRINIIRNSLVHKARKEQENYRFKMVNGIAINQPEDKFNHFFDSSRYAYMSLHSGAIGVNPAWF